MRPVINRTSSTPSTDPAEAPAGQVFRHLGVVFAVSALAATVFTAWTPAAVLPTEAVAQLDSAIATRVSDQLDSPQATLPPATEAPRPRVGVVAGHKGNDSGAVCADGLTEASVNLDVATRVQAGLEALGFQVDLLDEFDVRLTQYTALALVSVHADSCDYINDQATGFKVAAALDSPVPDKAGRLVSCLTDRYTLATGMPFHANSITFDMTRYHSYYEINSQTPAAVIEIGFMNLDRGVLTGRPEAVAQGIIDGIVCFARNEPVPRNPSPTSAP